MDGISFFGNLKSKDRFVVDGREYVVSSVVCHGNRVYIETTTGTLFNELASGYVEVKGK